MTRKKGQTEFLKWFGPIIEALKDLGGSAKPREISEWIGEKYKVAEEVLNERYAKSGQLKFPNQIAWARQYLVWEEILESSKHGVWTLTNKGWVTSINEIQAREIFLKWVKIFQDLRENKDHSSVDKEAEKVIELQETIEPENIQSNLKPTLIEVLKNLSPEGFEHICGRLLREYGFENIQITQRSHDGGIDGYGTLKINAFVSLSVSFQCKRYKGTVPTEKVQAFIGAMESNERRFEKGLLITTGSFANDALRIENSNIKLELIDGDKLVKMFEEIGLGVVKKIIYEPDMNFFEPYRDRNQHAT